MIYPKLRGILFLLAITLIAPSRAQDSAEVSIQFSVHLLPSKETTGESVLNRTEDLHYAHGDLEIPLQLKEGRQSILYPYRGPKAFSLFRRGSNPDGEAARAPVCQTTIPTGTTTAVLLLQLQGEKYMIRGFWFDREKLRKPGYLVNLSNISFGIQLGKKTKLQFPPKKTIPLPVAFPGDEEHAYLFLETFISEERNGSSRLHKSLESNLFFPKGDTQLNLLMAPSPRQTKLLNLSTQGIPNRAAQSALEKFLPSLKKKTPVGSN